MTNVPHRERQVNERWINIETSIPHRENLSYIDQKGSHGLTKRVKRTKQESKVGRDSRTWSLFKQRCTNKEGDRHLTKTNDESRTIHRSPPSTVFLRDRGQNPSGPWLGHRVPIRKESPGWGEGRHPLEITRSGSNQRTRLVSSSPKIKKGMGSTSRGSTVPNDQKESLTSESN